MTNPSSNVIALPTVAGVEVPVDAEGRFNLNAIHRAYEAHTGEKQPSKAPAQWMRTKQAQEFVSEVENETGKTCVISTEGRNGGTFAAKPTALAYALWLGGASTFFKLYKSIENIDAVLNGLQDFEVPDDLPDMYVYAIQEIDTGNIKFGISRDPLKRLSALQTGNSSQLELVACRKAENRFEDERALHADASEYRLRGEWFSMGALEVMQ